MVKIPFSPVELGEKGTWLVPKPSKGKCEGSE